MSQDFSFESYERYRIDYKEFSFLYYPLLKIMNIEFWDSIEEDSVELTIYENDTFDLTNSPFKDLDLLNHYLSIFKEQK